MAGHRFRIEVVIDLINSDVLEVVPAPDREIVLNAIAEALGGAPVDAIEPVSGGSSGARLFRIEAGQHHLLLRVEGPETPLLKRNPYRWIALRSAAAAGVAPKVHYIDEDAGVTISDFIHHRPFASYPGGAPALARALGDLVQRFQTSPPLPPLVDYRELVADMLEKIRASEVFAAGVLDPHMDQLEQIRAICPWKADQLVSSHNDPNPGNILFDGERLWLIDWESGYANDPLVDIAILADTMAPTPQLEDALLTAWIGRVPDRALRAHFDLVRRLTRLYYACFLLDAGASALGGAPQADASPPGPNEIQEAIARGRLSRGTPLAAFVLGKVFLEAFLTGQVAPAHRAALIPLL